MTNRYKLSTTFNPVSKGVFTGEREIIEGAIDSTIRNPRDDKGPLYLQVYLKDQLYDLINLGQ